MSLLDTKSVTHKPWTPAEVALLEAVLPAIAKEGIKRMARRLMRDMPTRTEQSIEQKLLKLSRQGCALDTSSSE